MKRYNCPDCQLEVISCLGCPRMKDQRPTLPQDYPINRNAPIVKDPLDWPWNEYGFEYKCCTNCANNPANGGSGFCNCTLPYLENGTTAAPHYYTTITTTSAITGATPFDEM